MVFPFILYIRDDFNKDVEKDPFPLNSVHLESNEEDNNEIVINLTNQLDADP